MQCARASNGGCSTNAARARCLFMPPCLAPRHPDPLLGSLDVGAMLEPGDEVLYLGMPGHVLKKPKDAEVVDSYVSVKGGGNVSATRYRIRLRDGSSTVFTGVTRSRLHSVDQATADQLGRARAAARRGRSRRDLKRRQDDQASGTASHAAAAAAAIAAAKLIDEARLRVPCAVCCRSVKTNDTECLSVAEAPPPRWLEKLQSTAGMHLLAPGGLVRAAHQLNHQNDPNATVHEQWLPMLLHPGSLHRTVAGVWSVDVCDECCLSLNGASVAPPSESIAAGICRGCWPKHGYRNLHRHGVLLRRSDVTDSAELLLSEDFFSELVDYADGPSKRHTFPALEPQGTNSVMEAAVFYWYVLRDRGDAIEHPPDGRLVGQDPAQCPSKCIFCEEELEGEPFQELNWDEAAAQTSAQNAALLKENAALLKENAALHDQIAKLRFELEHKE